jgi:hypothetical protein
MIRQLSPHEKTVTSFSATCDFTDLDLIPFFNIKSREGVSLNIDNTTRSIYDYPKDYVLGHIIDKHGVPFGIFPYSIRRIMEYNKDALKKYILTIGKDNIIKDFKEVFRRNRFEITLKDLESKINNISINSTSILLKTNSWSFCGNNIRITSCFNSNGIGYFTRNSENLIIYNQNIFKRTEQGEYPVLLSGIKKDSLLHFKQQIFNKSYGLPYSFSNVTIYIDYEWFLESNNKVLKNTLIKSLTDTYKDAEIILFDGKEFASKYIFSYQIPSFSTLAKKKNFISMLEKDLSENLAKLYYPFDYKAEIAKFMELYNQFTKEQSEEVKVTEAVIVEESALTAEDMMMIQQLLEDTGTDDEDLPVPEDVQFEEDQASTPVYYGVSPLRERWSLQNPLPELDGDSTLTSRTAILDQISRVVSSNYTTLTPESLTQLIEDVTRNGGT